MFRFIDWFETWLFNTFRRLLVVAALLALCFSGAMFFIGASDLTDSADVSATDPVEQIDFVDFQPEEPEEVEPEESAERSVETQSEESTEAEPQEPEIDPRITSVVASYGSVGVELNPVGFTEYVGRTVPDERRDEFLEGLPLWAKDVSVFYKDKFEEGDYYDEITATLDTYFGEFFVRVDEKALEAEVAEQTAVANNIVALAELTQSAFGLGVVVAAIIILIAFRVEVNLRHLRSLEEDSSE